jgi:hypothetical protein
MSRYRLQSIAHPKNSHDEEERPFFCKANLDWKYPSLAVNSDEGQVFRIPQVKSTEIFNRKSHALKHLLAST